MDFIFIISLTGAILLIAYGMTNGITKSFGSKRQYNGFIRPEKLSKHECQMPFWSKPVGTLYRCKHCGNVWRFTVDLYWVPASIDQWKSAGCAT